MHHQTDDEEEEDEDPVEKKKQDKEMQLQSDLDNAAALLGQTSVKDSAPESGLDALTGAKPATKGDWEKLAQDVYTKVIAGYAGRPGYDKFFGPALMMLLADKMRDTDMRLTATKLRDAAEKKARAEKEAKKAGGAAAAAAKKPKPKNLSTASAKDGIDITNCGYYWTSSGSLMPIAWSSDTDFLCARRGRHFGRRLYVRCLIFPLGVRCAVWACHQRSSHQFSLGRESA